MLVFPTFSSFDKPLSDMSLMAVLKRLQILVARSIRAFGLLRGIGINYNLSKNLIGGMAMLNVNGGLNTNVPTPNSDPSSVDPAAANLFSTLLATPGTQQTSVDSTGINSTNAAATDPTQLALAPGDVLDFARSALAGFVWAGTRTIGGYKFTVATITPRREGQNDIFQGDSLASSFGNLAVNAAEAVLPNPTSSTLFLSITAPGSTTPVIVTWNLGTGAFEVGSSVIPPGSFLMSNGDTHLFFSNLRVNPLATEVSNNTGALVRVPALENAMNALAKRLLGFAASRIVAGAVSGPIGAVINGALAVLSAAGGLIINDWKTFWGPAWRAAIDVDIANPGNTAISAEGRRISFSDIGTAINSFASNAGTTLINALNGQLFEPGPRQIDEIILTPRLDANNQPIDNSASISYKVTEALNQGADAFSILRTAWDVWDNKSNNDAVRSNAARVFYAVDPRMAVARDFITAFYSVTDKQGRPIKFANLDAAGRTALFQNYDWRAVDRDAYGDFRIRNAANLMGGAFGQFVRPGTGQGEFNARVQAFAEQLTRRGLDVNLGVTAIDQALQQARSANPYLGPADNADFIKSYFARTDLQKVTSGYAQADARSDSSVVAIADIPSLFLSAGVGGGAGGAWPRILDEVALGRMDLFEALAAVEAAGGANDPTSVAIKRLQTDLTALLTAPLTNREFQVDRDGLAVPPDIAKLRQQRSDLLTAYRADPTFNSLLTALRSRIEAEPQFADVLQGYFNTRNINFPNASSNLFVSVLPGVGLFDRSADLTKLPGTSSVNGVTTNQYLPVDFFSYVPAGASSDAVLSSTQGRNIADYITQYDLAPSQELVVQRPPAFNPGILPPEPGNNPSQPGRDDQGPFIWWDYYSLPNDPSFYYAPGNFGNNPYPVRLDNFDNDNPITPRAAEAYQAGGFGGLLQYVRSQPVNDPDQGRPFRFTDFVAANPDLPDAIKADPLKALDYYLTAGIYEGRPTSLSDTVPQVATRPAQPITNAVAFLNDTQNLFAFLASQPTLAAAVAGGNVDGGRLQAIASDYVLRNLGDPAKTSITFSPVAYFAANPTVAAELGNDLTRAAEHYLTVGYSAGLATAPVVPPAPNLAVDATALSYIASYPDLIAASSNFATPAEAAQWARDHFANFGSLEGRIATFDPVRYGQLNGDVQQAYGGDPLLMAFHYLRYGFGEGRRT